MIDNARHGKIGRTEFLEFAPQRRLLCFEIPSLFDSFFRESYRRGSYKLRLRFPYVQFWKSGDSWLPCTCTWKPFQQGDTLYSLPLPNQQSTGFYCLGGYNYKRKNITTTNPAEVIGETKHNQFLDKIDAFWNSQFTSDSTHNALLVWLWWLFGRFVPIPISWNGFIHSVRLHE